MYENAQWIDENGEHKEISVLINGVQSFVPVAPGNKNYAEIMRLVAEGQLTIAPADPDDQVTL